MGGHETCMVHFERSDQKTIRGLGVEGLVRVWDSSALEKEDSENNGRDNGSNKIGFERGVLGLLSF